ncbi:MAG: hypothetical protein ACE149_09355 [Armatimonadota bacterium]
MTGRRRSSKANLIALIVALGLCIWLLYKLFIGIPPAPPPVVKTAESGWDRPSQYGVCDLYRWQGERDEASGQRIERGPTCEDPVFSGLSDGPERL